MDYFSIEPNGKGPKGDKGDQGDPGPAGAGAGPSEVARAAGNSVAYLAELYLFPPSTADYNIIAARWPHYPFSTAIKRLWVRVDAHAVNLTVRVRNSDTSAELYSGTLTAGQTLFDQAVNITIPASVRPVISITPASGTHDSGNWQAGWVRSLS